MENTEQEKLGAIKDSFEDYLGRKDCLSSSDIYNLLISPLAFHIAQTEPHEDKLCFTLGSAIHCAIIEPHEFENRYQSFDDSFRPEPEKNYRSKKNKVWKTEMIGAAKKKGFQYLSKAQKQDVDNHKKSVERNPDAVKLISECTMFETSYYSQVSFGDRKYNLRCRPDMMGKKNYISIKSTKAPTFDAFPREISKYNYQAKEAFYWLVLNATRRAIGMPELENGFIIAIGEHETFVYEMNTKEMQIDGITPFINDGLHMIDVALKRYDKIKATNKFEGSEINHGGLFTTPIYLSQWEQNRIDNLISQNQ